MPTYKVLRRVDAFCDYVAEVEADSPSEAARTAYLQEEKISWRQCGTTEFDARRICSLRADGSEIEGTEFGDV